MARPAASPVPPRLLDARQADTRIDAGTLLVASRTLKDPRFAEAVILLLEHDAEGTAGVALNRPSAATLGTVIPSAPALADSQDVAFIGGPVGLRGMLFLIRSAETPTGARRVLERVHMSSDLDLLERLAVAPRRPDEGFRVYVGYSGWTAGQLEVEILRGDWHLLPGDADIVFAMSPGDIWPTLIERASSRMARRLVPPVKPS